MSKEELAKIMAQAKEPQTTEPSRAPGPEQSPGPKIGEGHAMGMFRLGAHELTQALAAFPDSNIKPMEEPGVLGNPTPQLVTQEMGGLKALDAKDMSLKDILDASPSQTPPSQQNERDQGREM